MAYSLISLLIAVLVFAMLAYGMYWVCTRFLQAFPPALWICGVFLLIILLLWISGQLPSGPVLMPLRR